MGLRSAFRSGVAAACIAGLAAPAWSAPGGEPAPRRAAGPQVRIAQAADFSRLEFHGAAPVVRRDGQTLTLRFAGPGPDISQLRVFPPKWLKSAELRRTPAGAEVVLTLADDADYKAGQADGAAFVNLFQKRADPARQQAAKAEAPPDPAPSLTLARTARPDPTPAGGVVRMEPELSDQQVLLRFTWKNPPGAAVFRRGEAIWVVFDARAKLDISKAPHGMRQFTGMRAVEGADFTALRIAAPASTAVKAVGEGATWTIALGPGPQPSPDLVKISRDEEQTAAALSAAMAGATKVVWLDDPVVGDRIAAVTALAPSKGLPSRREFVEMALLSSAQGLAIEPYAADVAVASDGDLVRIGRPQGLALSPAWAAAKKESAAIGAPQPTSMPALVDFDGWSKTGSGGFMARYDALQDAAATKTAQPKPAGGKAAPVTARMALARFLIGSELSYEAIGALNLVGRVNQQMMGDAEFRGLRGAAKTMAGRYNDAELDFASPVLTGDPSAALWRGYIAVQLGRYADARGEFANGARALGLFAPKWRARFARAEAEAALQGGDLAGARTAIDTALAAKVEPLEELAVRLTQARLFEAQGDKDRALRVYDAVSRAPLGALSSPAVLRATQIRLDRGDLTPLQAAGLYDGLRYRWRGDATELETIRALGQLYLNLGRYREALEALRSAGQRLPDLPQAVQLQADLNAAFRTLFLDGQADGLEPIQALALFYDFKELTPIGADGDLMVRRLARRLVDVDLLTQAAELLKYQADNRLDGVPKAQVSTDLALIYLMDRKPEDALGAINGSRTTILPGPLNLERRLISARALMELGRYDAALELIDGDKSQDALDVRAEVAWKMRNWALAGTTFEKSLGERWRSPAPLTPDDESKLLRVGVAYSMAGDDAGLTRMRDRYQGFVAGARSPDALRVALAGADGSQLAPGDFTKVTTANDAFAGWVIKMKQRFRDRPAPVGPATPPGAKGQAAPPPKGASSSKTAQAAAPAQG